MQFPSLNPLRVPPLIPKPLMMGYGKRLGKSEKGFVVFPRLHPDYVCWFNSCEKLDDWSFLAPATGSINTTLFKENIGSLQISIPANQHGHATALVTPCNRYFGFWWRIQTAISKFEQIWLFGTPTTYFAGIYPHAGTGRFYYIVVDSYSYPTGVGYVDPTIVVQQGVWYWIEIYRPSTGNSYTYFYVNGSLRWTLAPTTGSMGQWQSFRAGSMNGSGVPAMTMLIDYLRFADRYEYPPN